jgi:acyl-CoA thioesterase-1
VVATAAVLVWTTACGSRETAGSSDATTPASTGVAAPGRERAGRPSIVVLGDSLTAGLGLMPDQAYPALLQQRVNEAGFDYLVVNAGVSGDTSAGGLSRLDWALSGQVRVLIVALGGNDALRGLPPATLKENLARIIERAQSRRIEVVLAGMEAPPNWGHDYIVEFRGVYRALAQEYGVAFVPFLLDGVAGVARLNQPDGIHPTAEGARVVADTVWTALEPIVEADRSRETRGSASAGS